MLCKPRYGIGKDKFKNMDRRNKNTCDRIKFLLLYKYLQMGKRKYLRMEPTPEEVAALKLGRAIAMGSKLKFDPKSFCCQLFGLDLNTTGPAGQSPSLAVIVSGSFSCFQFIQTTLSMSLVNTNQFSKAERSKLLQAFYTCLKMWPNSNIKDKLGLSCTKLSLA